MNDVEGSAVPAAGPLGGLRRAVKRLARAAAYVLVVALVGLLGLKWYAALKISQAGSWDSFVAGNITSSFVGASAVMEEWLVAPAFLIDALIVRGAFLGRLESTHL